jgi:tetratricopeptide (TPR) repeat protein
VHAKGERRDDARRHTGGTAPGAYRATVGSQRTIRAPVLAIFILEALQAYSLGQQAEMAKVNVFAAIAFLQRAVSLDQNFAMAYANLALYYNAVGETSQTAESARKEYALRERTSEFEKLTISCFYSFSFTGNLETARGACELWAQTYPHRDAPWLALEQIYDYVGEYDKALTAAQEALRLNPGSGLHCAGLAFAYLYLNRQDEVKKTAEQAHAHNLDPTTTHINLYVVAFLQHDTAGLQRETAFLMANGSRSLS